MNESDPLSPYFDALPMWACEAYQKEPKFSAAVRRLAHSGVPLAEFPWKLAQAMLEAYTCAFEGLLAQARNNPAPVLMIRCSTRLSP